MAGIGRSLINFGLIVCLWWSGTGAAIASMHAYPESGAQVMLRSLQTLRDRRDQAWQVVLFKRMQGGRTESIHLRIVGFPDGAEFQHPEPLQLASSDRGWTLRDVSADMGLPANVGEYDIQEPVTQLTANAPLHIRLPISPVATELVVPPFVVKEWRQLVALQPSGR